MMNTRALEACAALVAAVLVVLVPRGVVGQPPAIVATQAGARPPVDTPAPLPSVALPPALDRVLRDYERAWSARDPRALAVLFTDDGFVLSGGHPPIRGRGAIERHYAGHGGPLSLRALAFATEGTVGWIVGGYARAPGEPDQGKFTLTLRRTADGGWLIASDMDNGNAARPD
jgi:ketosteroid isomerase-like protein